MQSQKKPVEKGHRNLHETKSGAADYQNGIWRLSGKVEKKERKGLVQQDQTCYRITESGGRGYLYLI